jgi:glycosyltransferase involved in cell wall biosynthesis
MHIAFVINALRAGGAEKLIATFARAIQDSEHRLTVITLRQNVLAVEQEVADTGARIVYLHHRKLFHPGRFRRLVALCQAESFDVIHTHLTMANILGGFAGWLTHTPVTTTLHNVTIQSKERPLHYWLENWVFRHIIDHPIAVGWSIADAHSQRIGDKHFTIIPNAVTLPEPLDAATRTAIRHSLIENPNAQILIAVGRLEEQKGFTDLLDAFALVQPTHPDAHLFIAGVGSLHDELAAKINVLGLGTTVHLLGLRHDVPQLLGASDMYVSSSWWEGLSVALLEAMAAGLPGVVTDVGDTANVFTSAMGSLVPARQPQVLAAALCDLLDQPDKWPQMGAAARDAIVAGYSAEVAARQLLQLYAAIQKPSKR